MGVEVNREPIFMFGADDSFSCPYCGVRLGDQVQVDEDEDGPIFEADCPTHGTLKVQSIEDDD